GQNGGAAFIFIYILIVITIGAPLMISELAIGRKAQSNPVGTFKKLNSKNKGGFAGYLAVFTSFIILSFYTVIAGWIFSYFSKAITGKLATIAPENLSLYFEKLAANTPSTLFWNALVIGLTGFVVISGVKDGIEKYSKILMPILLITLIALIFRSLSLEGASKGLE